jgi:hypothetical protein
VPIITYYQQKLWLSSRIRQEPTPYTSIQKLHIANYGKTRLNIKRKGNLIYAETVLTDTDYYLN